MKLLYQSDGVMLFEVFHSEDNRGEFTKIYQMDKLCESYGIPCNIKEVYYSTSSKDVIRGMHFQIPPHDHDKIVHVVSGAVDDVVVDLRKKSPNYRKCHHFRLSAETPQILYIPRGFAHGFKTLLDGTCMVYLVSSEYHKDSDSGILYSSINYDWKTENPVISSRDCTFVGIDEFDSPF